MLPNQPLHKSHGFTLLEILIVIAIIGMLTAVTISSLSDGRKKAQTTASAAELNQIRTGLFQLLADTGKGPNGCIFGTVDDPEVNLNAPQAGLTNRPTVGVTGGGCRWDAEDVAAWNGPYFKNTVDGWGNPYYLDPDYLPFYNCPGGTPEPVIFAIVSLGEDSLSYTCDDIFLELD